MLLICNHGLKYVLTKLLRHSKIDTLLPFLNFYTFYTTCLFYQIFVFKASECDQTWLLFCSALVNAKNNIVLLNCIEV